MPQLRSLTIPLTGDQDLRCPRCNSDRGLHFDEVSLIDPGGNVVPLHAPGGEGLSVVTATIADGAAGQQRHMIVLPHWCSACGDRGEIVLRQHAGRTSGHYREMDSAKTDAR